LIKESFIANNKMNLEVRQASNVEYEQFICHNFINSGPSGRERLPAMNYEKRVLSLLATGFPVDFTVEEIQEFFKDYKLSEDSCSIK